jgi:hypothetical protein
MKVEVIDTDEVAGMNVYIIADDLSEAQALATRYSPYCVPFPPKPNQIPFLQEQYLTKGDVCPMSPARDPHRVWAEDWDM